MLDRLSAKTCNNQCVELLVSPKYHCELAGEGVKYAWGIGKKFFCNERLEKKRTKNKFKQVVRSAIEHVRKDHVEKFSFFCMEIYLLAQKYITF